MLGAIVNTLSILAGSLIGLFFRGGIPEKYSKTIMHAIGLSAVLVRPQDGAANRCDSDGDPQLGDLHQSG